MPGLSADLSIREILARWPSTRDALNAAGLMGCGGAQGPDETLEFFARMHHVPLAPLMQELERAAIDAKAHAAPGPAPHMDEARRFVPFMLMSIALTLTAGATLGMLNLARLTTAQFGALTTSAVRAHAMVQVFGFVGLFVMGVAFHVLPRFAGRPLALARFVPLVFALQTIGAIATASAFGADRSLRTVGLGGACALTAAALLFTIAVVRTTFGARTPERFQRWIAAGAVWLIVATIGVAQAMWIDVTWLAPVWTVALWGFAGSWVLGIGRRIFPAFLAWTTRTPRAETPAFVAYQIGVLASAIGAMPVDTSATAPFAAAGALALIIGTLAFSWCLGIPGRHRPLTGDDAACRRIVSTAWVWLAVALATGPLVTIAAGLVPPLVTDFARHAFAFGFLTQVMMGVSGRILPVFTGHALWSPRARRVAYVAINAAVAIRALEALVAVGTVPPSLWPIVAWSGPIAVLAVVLFALNVVLTIYGRPAAATAGLAASLADSLVKDVLALPGALDVLVNAGFTPLANPVMRAALAGTVTLRQACALKRIPLEDVLPQLERLQNKPRKTIALTPVASG